MSDRRSFSTLTSLTEITQEMISWLASYGAELDGGVIVGQKRYTVEVTGEANHAGTAPMTMRKDALRGASQMIHAVMQAADQAGSPLVANVGKISCRAKRFQRNSQQRFLQR